MFFGGKVQRYSSTLSQGFKDEDSGNSPGWWATTVATYCPSRPSQLTQETQRNIAKEWIKLLYYYIEILKLGDFLVVVQQIRRTTMTEQKNK